MLTKLSSNVYFNTFFSLPFLRVYWHCCWKKNDFNGIRAERESKGWPRAIVWNFHVQFEAPPKKTDVLGPFYSPLSLLLPPLLLSKNVHVWVCYLGNAVSYLLKPLKVSQSGGVRKTGVKMFVICEKKKNPSNRAEMSTRLSGGRCFLLRRSFAAE